VATPGLESDPRPVCAIRFWSTAKGSEGASLAPDSMAVSLPQTPKASMERIREIELRHAVVEIGHRTARWRREDLEAKLEKTETGKRSKSASG